MAESFVGPAQVHLGCSQGLGAGESTPGTTSEGIAQPDLNTGACDDTLCMGDHTISRSYFLHSRQGLARHVTALALGLLLNGMAAISQPHEQPLVTAQL